MKFWIDDDVFGCFLDRTISHCVSSVGILLAQNQKFKIVLLIFILRLSLNSQFSEAISLISADQISLETFLSITGFFLEVIRRVFDQHVLHPVGGKHRSAAVPLVYVLMQYAFHKLFSPLLRLLQILNDGIREWRNLPGDHLRVVGNALNIWTFFPQKLLFSKVLFLMLFFPE